MSSALSVGLTLIAFTSQVDAIQRTGVQKVSLSWGDWSCPCVGIDGTIGDMNLTIEGEVALYPANTGTSCEAWDDGRYPGACESGGDPGKGKGFCAQKWCYVDACTCSKAREKAIYMKGATFKDRPLYYSYDTCDGTDTFTVRDEKEEALIQEAEVEIGGQKIAPVKSSSMDAHGATDHMAEVAEIAKQQTHESEETNGHEDKKKKKKTEKVKGHKSTSGHKHSDKADVHQPEDGDNDSEDDGIMAGLSKELKAICSKLPDEKVVGRGGCRCIGIKHRTMKWEAEVNISNKIWLYPTDIGNYCAAWDKDSHPACKSETKEKPPWCNSNWCYVDPCTCPVYSTKVSKDGAYIQKARFEGHPLFYSYQACGESSDPWSFANNPDACTSQKAETNCSGDCKWSSEEGVCLENTISSYCKIKLNRMDSWQATKADNADHDKPWWQFW